MTAKLFNLREEREARNVRAEEELRKSQSVEQIIHDQTYTPNSLIVAGEAVEALLRESEEFGRGGESEFVDCVLCWTPISGVTSDYQYYTDGGPLHKRCYEETYTPKRLREAEEWAEENLARLNRLKDYD